MSELLAIVEVEKEKKVLCSSPECKRSVYKRIHIVLDNGKITVLGEKCFTGIFGGKLGRKSKYTGGLSKKLTDEERLLLINNTEELIQELEKEHSAKIEKEKSECVDFENNLSDSEPELLEHKIQTNQESQQNLLQEDVNSRQVRCAYCGKKMLTQLKFNPAKGHKCEACKESNVTVSLYAQQYRKRT